MKKTSFVLASLALAFTALGSAQAATPATQRAPEARHAMKPVAMHSRVVEARAAQQRHWIAAEQRSQRIDASQAASLRAAVADIERDQQALRQHGAHESVAQALAMSHRQDVLDWAIRAGQVAFEPQKIAALDTLA